MDLYMRNYDFIKGIDVQRDCKRTLQGNAAIDLVREIIEKGVAVGTHGTTITNAGKIFLSGLLSSGPTYHICTPNDNAKEVCAKTYPDPDKRDLLGSVGVIIEVPKEFLSQLLQKAPEGTEDWISKQDARGLLLVFKIKRKLILDKDMQRKYIADYEKDKSENFPEEFPYYKRMPKVMVDAHIGANEDVIYKGIGRVIPPYLIRGATYLKDRKSYYEGIKFTNDSRRRVFIDGAIDDNRIVFYENPYYFNNLTLEEQQKIIENDFLSRNKNRTEDTVK